MKDLQSKRLILGKGWLFLFQGLLAGGLLLWACPSWTNAALLGIALWSFCRFYYFAFYVIEHYVDPSFRFAGLWHFFRYSLRGGKVR